LNQVIKKKLLMFNLTQLLKIFWLQQVKINTLKYGIYKVNKKHWICQ